MYSKKDIVAEIKLSHIISLRHNNINDNNNNNIGKEKDLIGSKDVLGEFDY